MLKGENSSKGRVGDSWGRGRVLQVVLGDVVVLRGVPLIGRPAASAVRGLGSCTPTLLLRQSRRCVCLLPQGRGSLGLGTASKRQLERMAGKRRPRLSQGLWQRAEVAGHVLRYLVCVGEVLLEELVVGIIVI